MKRNYLVAIITLIIIGLVTACNPSDPTPTPASASPTPLPPQSTPTLPPDTPTPTPPKELTICQAEEPNTLFVYGGPSRAARNVLEAIYDGPIDSRSYQFQPVILEKLPNLADGDAALQTVQVSAGDKVVDVNGQVVDLAPGVALIGADGQAVTFEDGGVITTTQLVVTFTLRSDVTWADGEPLTADDSHYSFELVGELESPSLRHRWERTRRYDAVSERTIVWGGLPGYRDVFYFLNFYHPLPRHMLGGTDIERLLNAEVAQRKPLGWGPFVVEEWVAGERITLVRNSNYFRASEGLPHIDRLVFRFVPDLPTALDQLLTGECDIITQDLVESGDPAALLEAAESGAVQLITSPSNEWEHLDFGLTPAEWVRRPDYFADVRTRQAIARCIDREQIAREAFPYGEPVLAHSYVASEHPLYADDQIHRWSYDPDIGRSMLQKAGWRDEDSDGIREAYGVSGVASGTPFSVTLLVTDDDPARGRVAQRMVQNLADCGIDLGVDYLPAKEFFADGPDGPVFGRNFELALFSWLNGADVPCSLYLSSEIPQEDNWWATSNNPGYSSTGYDEACRSALSTLPGMENHDRFHREAQRIFSYDLPVLPLYFVPKMVAARPEISGLILDPNEYVDLWNIESFDLVR